jgi:hypothetical protein
MKSTSASSSLVAPAFLIVVFVAAAFALSLALNISPDEWNSLRTTSRGLGYAYATAIGYEALPPLYPLALDLWRGISPKIQFARVLSILVTTGTLAIAWRFARSRLPEISPTVFAAAVAVAPFAVFAAVEIRLYAMAIALSAALTATFLAGFIDDRRDRRARIAHVVLVAVAPYLQYYIAAQVLGEIVALLIVRPRRAVRDALPYAVGIVAWLPAVIIARSQLSAYDDGATFAQQLHGLVITFTSFVLPDEWLGIFPTHPWVIYVALALFAAACALLAWSRPRIDAEIVAQIVVVGTIVTFFLMLPIVLHGTVSYPRHIATLFFPLLALAALVVDRSMQTGTTVWRPIAVLYFASALASLAVTYGTFTKEGNYRRAAEYLMTHGVSGEPVYAFNLESVGPLEVYYRGKSAIHGIPHDQHFDHWDRRSFDLTSTDQVRRALAHVASGERVWIYLGPDCFALRVEEQGGCQYVRDVVTHDFTTLSSKKLTNAQLLDLERR